MGGGSYDSSLWTTRSTAASKKSASENFATKAMNPDMNPYKVLRESRDSAEHPESTPIIIALDVTGSMGHIPQYMVTKGLGVLFTEILNRLPVKDPQIMVMAIGDAAYDRAPIQVGQFESDLRVMDWLSKIYLEGGGGGNQFESYELAYWFALKHTSCDSMIKRRKPGYIFTIGDETPAPRIDPTQVIKVFGDQVPDKLSFADLITEVRASWVPYHITCMDSSSAQYLCRNGKLKEKWSEVMGQNALYLDDHKALSELVVSILQIDNGVDVDTVASSWSGSTSLVIREATKGLATTGLTTTRKALVEF